MTETAKKPKTDGVRKVLRAVVFRLSGIFLWGRIVFGPAFSGADTHIQPYVWLYAHQELAIFSFIVCSILFFLFTNPWLILWYVIYLLLFPIVILILLGRYVWSLGKIIYKMIKFSTSVYFFIFSMLTTPIMYFICLSDANTSIIKASIVYLVIATFILLIFLMRLSRNPLIWLQPLLDLVEKFINSAYGSAARDKFVQEVRDKEAIENKLKEIINFLGSLQNFEKGIVTNSSLFSSVSIRVFLTVFLASALIVITTYSFIYYASWIINPGFWHLMEGVTSPGWGSWLFTSLAVFSTSSYLVAFPNDPFTRILMSAETCSTILVVSIFFLQFSHGARESILSTMEEMKKKVVYGRGELEKWTKIIEVDASCEPPPAEPPDEA